MGEGAVGFVVVERKRQHHGLVIVRLGQGGVGCDLSRPHVRRYGIRREVVAAIRADCANLVGIAANFCAGAENDRREGLRRKHDRDNPGRCIDRRDCLGGDDRTRVGHRVVVLKVRRGQNGRWRRSLAFAEGGVGDTHVQRCGRFAERDNVQGNRAARSIPQGSDVDRAGAAVAARDAGRGGGK